jgi:hypothetical protein
MKEFRRPDYSAYYYFIICHFKYVFVSVASMPTLKSHKAGLLINDYQAPPGHIYAAHNWIYMAYYYPTVLHLTLTVRVGHFLWLYFLNFTSCRLQGHDRIYVTSNTVRNIAISPAPSSVSLTMWLTLASGKSGARYILPPPPPYPPPRRLSWGGGGGGITPLTFSGGCGLKTRSKPSKANNHPLLLHNARTFFIS